MTKKNWIAAIAEGIGTGLLAAAVSLMTACSREEEIDAAVAKRFEELQVPIEETEE